jgi:organic hydroperoxide reductase OsmC/OhrA
MSHEHVYETTLHWEGSTAAGYEAYDRDHEIALPPGEDRLDASADQAFRGDPGRTNPEQLFLAAASSCQMLSFLAIAARSDVDVLAYDDRATAIMPEDRRPVWVTAITLRHLASPPGRTSTGSGAPSRRATRSATSQTASVPRSRSSP